MKNILRHIDFMSGTITHSNISVCLILIYRTKGTDIIGSEIACGTEHFYVIDSNGCLDKGSPKIFSKREDAFALYKDYASEFISWYNKHHNIINDMKTNMNYDDEELEFSISNSHNGNCSTHFEWSEAVLQKFFIS